VKNVLLLAYYLPPLGMGGTQRLAKFAKYLPEFGWQPFVVSVKEIAYHAYDASLLEELRTVPVYRTGSLDPQRLLRKFFSSAGVGSATGTAGRTGSLTRALNGLLAWIFIPDSKILWLPFAFRAARKIIRREKIDCVLTSSPPHSVHLLGCVLSRLCGVPWVADLRDGWAGGNFQSEPTRLHRWLNARLEKYVLRRADGVISVSAPLTKRLLQKSGREDGARFHTITNGFDACDFEQEKPQARRDAFTISYVGTLSGMAPCQSFLQALSGLLAETPALRPKLRVNFAGLDLDGSAQALAADLGLHDVAEFKGYCPHPDAVTILRQSDLLLYPVAEHASDDFIPGKTFEYMAAGKPVLAIGPEVEGVRLLSEVVPVDRVGHDDYTAIAQRIKEHVETGPVKCAVSAQKLSSFERRFLTERLRDVLARAARVS